MTYFFELIQPYIDNLVTLIVGSISTILFYRFKIRKQDVEVTAAEFSTVKDISDKYLTTISEMSDQITKLHVQVIDLNQRVKHLVAENTLKDLILVQKDANIKELIAQIDLLSAKLEQNVKLIHFVSGSRPS